MKSYSSQLLAIALYLVMSVSGACNVVSRQETGLVSTTGVPSLAASAAHVPSAPTGAVLPTAVATVGIAPGPTPTAPATTVAPAASLTSAAPNATALVATPATDGPPAPRRIVFQAGATSVQIEGALPIEGLHRYVLHAQAGQSITVSISSGQAQMLLQVSGADGSVQKTLGSGPATWSCALPTTQDYALAVATANGAAASYTLHVTIAALTRTTTLVPTTAQPYPDSSAEVTLPAEQLTPGQELRGFDRLAGAAIVAHDGTFLGVVSKNAYDSQSILNKYGQYGGQFSSKSIFNAYGKYGGEFSPMSPFNPYTSTPPKLVKGNVTLGFLSANKHITNVIDIDAFLAWLNGN